MTDIKAVDYINSDFFLNFIIFYDYDFLNYDSFNYWLREGGSLFRGCNGSVWTDCLYDR